ncbi:carboxypeptidase-like regulatory domain-containing protein [Arthrobacter sp. SLBN-100]|uniref:carboxypeptidase-like regulatory domain-containing protein n=1 Tax=Arthrobacter sp. SLBN-100 TaxID=2768450 RepID=UPI00135AE0C5|nr:carboxypeptidase-like regulatory domain-containing protein [Arthrobacter sp. SLBN-100]
MAGMLASCATGPSNSGIKGHVTVDAGCPEIINATPCTAIPLPARITIRDAAGTMVRETTANDQGDFQLELQPGTYQLHAVNPSGAPMPSAPPENVVVEAGSFTEVKVAFDSGVR